MKKLIATVLILSLVSNSFSTAVLASGNWVQENNTWNPRQVKVGMDNGVNIEICEGLNEGEIVAVDRKSNTGIPTGQDSGNKEESPFMPKPPGKK